MYFDNVGGEITDAVLLRMNPFSRIPLCGLISEYRRPELRGLRNVRSLLVNRIKLQGFIRADRRPAWSTSGTSGWSRPRSRNPAGWWARHAPAAPGRGNLGA